MNMRDIQQNTVTTGNAACIAVMGAKIYNIYIYIYTHNILYITLYTIHTVSALTHLTCLHDAGVFHRRPLEVVAVSHEEDSTSERAAELACSAYAHTLYHSCIQGRQSLNCMSNMDLKV